MSVEEIEAVLDLSARLDKVGTIWHIQPTSALSGTFPQLSLLFHFRKQEKDC